MQQLHVLQRPAVGLGTVPNPQQSSWVNHSTSHPLSFLCVVRCSGQWQSPCGATRRGRVHLRPLGNMSVNVMIWESVQVLQSFIPSWHTVQPSTLTRQPELTGLAAACLWKCISCHECPLGVQMRHPCCYHTTQTCFVRGLRFHHSSWFKGGRTASHPLCKVERVLCGPKLVFNLYWNGRCQGWVQILCSYTGCSRGRWVHVPG